MLISSPEELRLYVASHALDDIESVRGILAISESDFLADKLGSSLYSALSAYYASLDETNVAAFVEKVAGCAQNLTPVEQLLQFCQRCIAYDALARHVDIHALSVNSAGINVSEAEDYKKPDPQTLANFKAAANREAHAALNMLLQALESWCKEDLEPLGSEVPESGTKAYYAKLWKADSRYYYLAATLVFPSAIVLNDYLNIYESREKFIQLLPAVRKVQEDLIEPVIGEDVLVCLVASAPSAQDTRVSSVPGKTLHRIRKAAASFLEAYLLRRKPGTTTQGTVLNAYQAAINDAHAEGECQLNMAISLLTDNLASLDAGLVDAMVAGPLCPRLDLSCLVERDDLNEATAAKVVSAVEAVALKKAADKGPRFVNNAKGNVIFAFPAIH